MTRWYLVRHAETVWNRDNRIQGASDTPLSPLGLKQAASLCRHFASRAIRAIVCSSLQRSQQTARAIAQGNGQLLTPRIAEGLGEIHLGEWEGLTPEEVNARYGAAYDRWRVSPSSLQIPGAESLAVFRKRVRRAREQLLATLEAQESVIVTHGGVIATLLADALRADYDHLLRHLRLDNAGITAVEFGNGQVSSVLWINRTNHLDGLEDLAGPPKPSISAPA